MLLCTPILSLQLSVCVCVCVSFTEDAVIAKIMPRNYTKALFSAVHWSILTVDTESLSPCGRVGSTIFVSTISSNHWVLRAKLQFCQSCYHPLLRASRLFSWDLAIHWKIPWVLQMNPAVTPNAKKAWGHRSESLFEFSISSLFLCDVLYPPLFLGPN